MILSFPPNILGTADGTDLDLHDGFECEADKHDCDCMKECDEYPGATSTFVSFFSASTSIVVLIGLPGEQATSLSVVSSTFIVASG